MNLKSDLDPGDPPPLSFWRTVKTIYDYGCGKIEEKSYNNLNQTLI